LALFFFKFAVTGACFWYLLHEVDIAATARLLSELDFRWFVLAVVVLAFQIPLAGVRLLLVFKTVSGRNGRFADMVAVTAVGVFFGQVLPNVAGDAIRVWLLARLHPPWVQALATVVIDRAVGLFVLFAIAFAALLSPAAGEAMGGYRGEVLVVLGVALVAGTVGVLAAPLLARVMGRWPILRPLARFAVTARRSVLGPLAPSIFGLALAIHLLALLSVWMLISAQGLAFGLGEVAVIFALMMVASILPISIGGWGLRELAVTSFFQVHEIPAERALVVSICFGLSLLVAALPGAIVWLVYRPEQRDAPLAPEE